MRCMTQACICTYCVHCVFPLSLCVDTDDGAAVDHHMDAVFSHLPEEGGGALTAVLGVSHQGVEPMGGWVGGAALSA